MGLLIQFINILLPGDITDVESKVAVWPERPLAWRTGCNLWISDVWSDIFHSSFFVLLKGKPKIIKRYSIIADARIIFMLVIPQEIKKYRGCAHIFITIILNKSWSFFKLRFKKCEPDWTQALMSRLLEEIIKRIKPKQNSVKKIWFVSSILTDALEPWKGKFL